MFLYKNAVKIIFTALIALTLFLVMAPFKPTSSSLRYIVQGTNTDTITELTEKTGGEITHTLPIINAIGAKLTEQQRQTLLRYPQVIAIYADRTIHSAGKDDDDEDDENEGDDNVRSDLAPDLNYAARIEASRLHHSNITGRGISVAVIDTGIDKRFEHLTQDTEEDDRILAYYDAIRDKENKGGKDGSGHGSHVASIAVSSGRFEDDGGYAGIAPDADLVSIKAFDKEGKGTYLELFIPSNKLNN